MSSVGIFGLLWLLLSAVLPIVILIFVLMWVHQIKSRNENQISQNQKIIQLLEELNSKYEN